MNQVTCAKLARWLCPVRYLPLACPKSPKKLVKTGDGGCQPTNSCPYCCKAGCDRGKRTDSRCKWTGTECITCHTSKHLVDNGLPILPNPDLVVAAVPSEEEGGGGGWSSQSLGDSFKIHASCNALGRYVTGVTLWMKQMNAAQLNLPIESLAVRLSIFSLPGQILAVDWIGECTAKRYLNVVGVFQVECAFAGGGGGVFLTALPGGQCVPSLPTGEYSLVVSLMDSAAPGSTLGWLATFPNTGCHHQSLQAPQCAFSQAAAGGEFGINYVDLCGEEDDRYPNRVVENLAFRIAGSKTAPKCAST